MFYMLFESPHQDESNSISFIRNRSLKNKLSAKIFSICGDKLKEESFLIDNNEYLNELKKFINEDEKNKINHVYLSTDDIGLINEIEKK